MAHGFFTMIGVLDRAREAIRYAAGRLRDSLAPAAAAAES
jgi:hypothetical protein